MPRKILNSKAGRRANWWITHLREQGKQLPVSETVAYDILYEMYDNWGDYVCADTEFVMRVLRDHGVTMQHVREEYQKMCN